MGTARLKERSRSHKASATKTHARETKIPTGEAEKPAVDARVPAGEGKNSAVEAEIPSRASRVPAGAARVPATGANVSDREPEIAVGEPEIPAQETKAPGRRAATRAASLNRTRTVMPPPLKGSHGSLQRQNERSEADNLERIEDEDDLADRIARKFLVPVPTSAGLGVNENLPENHRYCRPWTARFLADLARVHEAQFHRPLEVNSAVRTVEYQKRLMETNGNAAAAEGDIVSPHLTGATIDIAKTGLSRQEIGWMRSWLLPLQNAGKIDVEEEFQQACFHITVYKSYVPPKPVGKAGQRKPGQAGSGAGKANESNAGAPGALASLGR